MPSPRPRSRWLIPTALGLVVAAFVALWATQSRRASRGLVVYCAHDLVFAEPLLRRFEAETEIPITIVGDTEASKSLGLVRRIEAEAAAPQCDVFWNNQLLGTMQLAEAGLLRPYRGEHWKQTPPQFRDDDAQWCGFAGRMRVVVSRGDRPPGERTLAIADPMFGTTLTHAALMWDRLGPEGFAGWYESAVEDDRISIVPGNGPACRLVVDGRRDAAWTDTDDAFSMRADQIAAGEEPMRITPYVWPTSFAADFLGAATPDEEPATILIPNTVAIVRGTDRVGEAELLVDWLLSPATERSLAFGPSRQIPLKPAGGPLPPEVDELMPRTDDGVDLKELFEARRAALDWLTKRAAGETPTNDGAGE